MNEQTNNEYEIESGIPIPPAQTRGRIGPKYPWNEMEIGDSFVYPKSIKAARGVIYGAGKKSGKKFTARELNGQVRIWRTK